MKKIFSSATGRIATALCSGILFGFIADYFSFGNHVLNYLKPLGTAWIKMLRALSIPVIVFSLTKGILDLKDMTQLSKMGGKAALFYVGTTVMAGSLGLFLANFVIRPGSYLSADTKAQLLEQYPFVPKEVQSGEESKGFLMELIPSNLFEMFSTNEAMLSVIFTSIIFAVAILQSESTIRQNMSNLFSDLNAVVMRVIDFVMLLAPYAVFALMAAMVVEVPHSDMLLSMLMYVSLVVFGLSILTFVLYPLAVQHFTGLPFFDFIRGASDAQLVAVSSSSSVATLPVTMECATKNLDIKNETASFVLPIGATCNMDGTSMYQSIAVLFVAQLYGIDLSFSDQLAILATATIGSIGAAAVPGGGIVMLMIVLEQAGLGVASLGIILALDRPLDMLRTVTNVTSDLAIAKILDHLNIQKS